MRRSLSKYGMWIVCGWLSSLFEWFFAEFSGFPTSKKADLSKFQFDLETVDEEPLRGHATANSNSL